MRRIIPLVVIILLSILYFSGVSSVPFHPDEATQIFMSADFRNFFASPANLYWQAEQADDVRQKYRLLDAPLTRNLIGVGLWITGQQPIDVDWDWSKTWEANQQSGALPDSSILLISRLSVAVFFPCTLWLMFVCGQKLGGMPGAWAALLLTASNAFILLHTRRAMAESGLLFFSVLSITCIFKLRDHNWLCAIPVALAINAKQSAAPLILVALIVLLWPDTKRLIRQRLLDMGKFSLLFALIFFLLNPVFWAHPALSIQAAISARSDLLARQVQELSAQNPALLLSTPSERTAGMIAQLYFTPLAYYDVGNYILATEAEISQYQAIGLHHVFRNYAGGVLLIVLEILAVFMTMRNIIKLKNRDQTLALTGLLLSAAFVILAFPIPFQRYYLPVLPWGILISSVLFKPLLSWIVSLFHKK